MDTLAVQRDSGDMHVRLWIEVVNSLILYKKTIYMWYIRSGKPTAKLGPSQIPPIIYTDWFFKRELCTE